MKEAKDFLDEFGIKYSLEIVSAHRTARKMVEYATTARKRGLRVIIAGAGGAAHLPGMVAALTTLPVVGVPVKTKSLDVGLIRFYQSHKCRRAFPSQPWR
jgi:5-(carboxyamino)imidazole ribonucleotide mutase